MNSYLVAVEGLSVLEDIENLDERILVNARRAINRTLDRTRTRADREIREQVAFRASYLSTRLKVTKYATGNTLAGVITARDRPTSLARFAKNRTPGVRGGVTVQVAPGVSKVMGRAFIMSLKNGNLGLAVRMKPGESLRNKKYVKSVGNGLYLLYGPSVNQVFAGVAEDSTPQTADFLEQEFSRLMDL